MAQSPTAPKPKRAARSPPGTPSRTASYAESVVLSTESPDEHRQMLEAYIQQFQPDGQAEFDLLEEMVAAKWRQRRLWAIEAELFEIEMPKQQKIIEEGYTDYSEI